MKKNSIGNILPSLILALFSMPTLFAQSPKLVIPAGLKEIVGIHHVSISPDQKFMIAVAGRNIQVYDYKSGLMYRNIQAKGSMSKASYSTDSRTAFVSGDDELVLLDLEKMEIRQTFPVGLSGLSHAQAPDGKAVFFGYEGLQRYDVGSNTVRVLKEFPEAWGTLKQVSVSPDSKQILIYVYEYKSGIERSVLLDAGTGAVLKEYPIEKNIFYGTFTGKGNIVKVNHDRDNDLFTISWHHPLSLKQIGNTLKIEGADGFDDRFACIPGTDDLWGSIADGMKVELISPDKPYKELPLSGVVSKNRYGTWEATTVALNRDVSRMVIGCDDNQVIEIDLNNGNSLRNYGFQVFSPNRIAGHPGFKGLAMLDIERTLLCISSESGHIRQRILGKQMVQPVFSSNGKKMMASNGAGAIIWDTEQFKSLKELSNNVDVDLMHYAHGEAGAFSTDDKMVAVNGNQVLIANASTGDVLYNLPTAATNCFFAPDNKTLYTYYKYPYAGKEENYLQAWDLITQRKKWQIDFTPAIFAALFRVENGRFLLYDTNSGAIIEINPLTGAYRKIKEKLNSLAAGAEISNTGKYITDQGKVYDSQTLQQLAMRPGIGYVHTGYFYGNDHLLINPLETNDIQWTQWEKSKDLGRLILLAENDEWAFITPDGRFDASPEMMKKLYYTKGTEVIPLDRLSEKYFAPKLFAQLLEEGSTPEEPANNIEDLKFPPSVQIHFKEGQRNLIVDEDTPTLTTEAATGQVMVEASASDDVVAEIRLFHNGKRVENTRNLIVEDDLPKGEKQRSQTFQVALVEGDNIFTAVALNSQLTESAPATLTVVKKKTAPTPKPGVKPAGGATMHLVIIGINAYKNPKYNLNYAQADAAGFRAAITDDCGKIVINCKEHYLTDNKAVKAGIVAELETIAAEAEPQDLFVLYYAGHGVVSEANKEFYLVPHDVTQLYGQDEALAQKGISAQELKQFAQRIKAQKQIFILDACQSSGALETVATRGAAEEKAIAQLARATGTHWLTAAGSEQFAAEFAQLGHGVFTYAMLEGLKGAADGNRDSQITVKELDAYLQNTVPDLTEKYRGTPQYPASYGFGNDFPVGIVKY